MIARVMYRASQSEVKRVDDNEEVFAKRIQTYSDSTMPIVNIFKKEGRILELDAEKDKNSVIEQFLHEVKGWELK